MIDIKECFFIYKALTQKIIAKISVNLFLFLGLCPSIFFVRYVFCLFKKNINE